MWCPPENTDALVTELIHLLQARMLSQLMDKVTIYNHQHYVLCVKLLNLLMLQACHMFSTIKLDICNEAYELSNAQQVNDELKRIAKALSINFGLMMKILRISLTGEKQGLPLLQTIGYLGADETVNRLRTIAQVVDKLDLRHFSS